MDDTPTIPTKEKKDSFDLGFLPLAQFFSAATRKQMDFKRPCVLSCRYSYQIDVNITS